MNKIVVKDIFDSNGVLLIKAGTVVKENTPRFYMLDALHAFEHEDDTFSDSLYEKTKIEFKEKFHPISIQLEEEVNQVSNIINHVLHDNKEQPWYFHLKALTNHGNWLYSHSINVSIISGILGLSSHLNEKQLQNLIFGALLHDIGKLLIPKKILLELQQYPEREFPILNTHPDLGHSILEEFNLANTTKKIILQHHERLDGTGYPRNLTKSKISYYAQIVAIADTLDLMTSSQSNTGEQSIENVLLQMKDNPGYNKSLVETLIYSLG